MEGRGRQRWDAWNKQTSDGPEAEWDLCLFQDLVRRGQRRKFTALGLLSSSAIFAALVLFLLLTYPLWRLFYRDASPQRGQAPGPASISSRARARTAGDRQTAHISG